MAILLGVLQLIFAALLLFAAACFLAIFAATTASVLASGAMLLIMAVGVGISVTATVAIIKLPWERGIKKGFKRDLSPTELERDHDNEEFKKVTRHFFSKRTKCEAWLYTPKRPRCIDRWCSKPPVILMANGAGMQKDIILPSLAARLASHGYAVFLFDYRSYGGSDGEPRHWLSPSRQLEDYRAALTFVKGHLGTVVDTRAVVLCGPSYGGAHSLVTASRAAQGDVAAVIALEPYLSNEHMRWQWLRKYGLLRALRVTLGACSDILRRGLGLPRVYFNLVGRLSGDDLALAPFDDEDVELFFSKLPRRMQGGWKNQALVGLWPEYAAYWPMRHLPNIRCPVLLVAGQEDELAPPWLIKKAVKYLKPGSRYVELPGTHMSLYDAPELLPEILRFLEGTLFASSLGMSPEEQQQDISMQNNPAGEALDSGIHLSLVADGCGASSYHGSSVGAQGLGEGDRTGSELWDCARSSSLTEDSRSEVTSTGGEEELEEGKALLQRAHFV